MIAALVVVFLFSLLALGCPISFALLLSGVAGLWAIGGGEVVMSTMATMPHDKATVFEFLAIPMFLLMAEFVLRSGIADDLFKAAAAWVGRVPGGLGIATALAGAGFAAICGSSTASAATLSSTSLPAMIKNGYEPRMAAGVVAISGTLAMLIPPSIAMVLYGLLAGVNIAKLLVAGIVPGALITLTIAATTYILAKQDPRRAPVSTFVAWREKLARLRLVGPMLVLFSAVSVSIYTGFMTPTEASALGAFAAAVLYFVRKKGNETEVVDIVVRSTRTSCMLALIIIGANVLSTFLTITQTTQSIIAWVGGLPMAPWVIMLLLVMLYLILGAFMDQTAILVLTTPVVAPLVASLGYDLVWWGVIKIVTAELGLVLPPLGLNAFVVAKYSKTPPAEVFRGVLPHVYSHSIAIAMLVAFPAISLWLPNRM